MVQQKGISSINIGLNFFPINLSAAESDQRSIT